MRYYVTIGGTETEVEVLPEGITVNGRPVTADLAAVPGTDVRSLLLDGASHALLAHRVATGRWALQLGGRRWEAEVLDERTKAIREMTGAGAKHAGPRPLEAPMPGLVVKIEVAPGDEVAPGQGLVIIEAMKMENELKADAAGRVKAVRVAPGQAVDKGQVLVEFESPDAEGEA